MRIDWTMLSNRTCKTTSPTPYDLRDTAKNVEYFEVGYFAHSCPVPESAPRSGVRAKDSGKQYRYLV